MHRPNQAMERTADRSAFILEMISTFSPQATPVPRPAVAHLVLVRSDCMLEVHPAPHAAHGWRDFFVHIATIVIGLLVALGLERFAEGIHHRREVREARDSMASRAPIPSS